MTEEVRRDGGLVAARRAVAANVAGLQMRRSGNQFIAVPHAGGETGLIVRGILGRMRTSIHPDGHGRAGFPRTDDPRDGLARDGIRLRPDPQAKWTSRDMPLGLEPADALRHGDDRLSETQSLCPTGFIEGQSRPIDRVGTAAALERVFVINRGPGSGEVDLRHGGYAGAQ